MGNIELAALASAYRLAEPSTADVLVRRLRGETLDLLRHWWRLPRRLVDAVLASGDRELIVTLARNATPGQSLRLARLGDPEVGRALYEAERWSRRCGDSVRAAVLMAADPSDPAWRAPGGLVDELLGETWFAQLSPALCAPFPELVLHALRLCGHDAPLPMVLRAARTLLEHGGPEQLAALAALAEAEGGLSHPGLAARLRRAAAAPDPGALLNGDISPTDELMYFVRLHSGRKIPAGVLPDWDLVRAEHGRRPFDASAVMDLNQLPGCPQELAVEGLRADPRTTLVRGRGPLPLSALTGPEVADERSYVPDVLRRGLAEGWLSAEQVLTDVTPAAEALQCLPQGEEPVRKAVRELTAPMGADPAAWLALYRRISRFEGTATALVAAACADAARSSRAPSWPRATGAAFPSREPEGPRGLFQRLFEYAEEEAQEALVPYLDGRAVQHLLVFGAPSPRLRARIIAVHGRSAHLANASRWDLPGEIVEELLELDDPEVNEKLYLYGAIAWQERARILAGRGRRGGHVPVNDGLLDELGWIDLRHHRNWLSAGLLSGDPRVLRVVLARIRTHTEGGRLRMLIRLWEQHGPRAVQSLMEEEQFPGRTSGAKHPLPAATHKTVHQALAAPDGLALLRARLAAEEQPGRLVSLLRRTAPKSVAERVRHLADEGTTLPWPQLLQAHADEPLSADLLCALAQRDDCPRPLLLDALGAGPVDGDADGMPWLARALQDGRLSAADVVRRCRPAPGVVSFLVSLHSHPSEVERPSWRPLYCAARRLAREELGTDPEAWAAALLLLPDFTGSLTELLSTAAAVTA
ncbi:hypothetical protein [Streptomyces sp. A1547]|uniref:hypothetical protein n=1 Tax=Streptomyces sp. A1547 TaxID=2563105 RepID=UPI00109EE294|nr:hypothetical protein [Streptomyces sp. A1547]THA23054.1 hypothetical protein E6W17_42050 [Streptomyces sp. A1547]